MPTGFVKENYKKVRSLFHISSPTSCYKKLNMGISKGQKGVVKLVHPGRHLEIHREPVMASEIMRKNPRHSVALPDVFKFPWNVVGPESVLLPGEVFYIIPNRTIYKLLKARGCNQPHEQQEKQSQKDHDRRVSKKTAFLRSSAGMTPKHPRRCLSWSGDSISDQEQDSDQITVKLNQVCSLSEVKFVDRSSNHHQEFDHKVCVNASVKARSCSPRRTALPETTNGDMQIKSSRQVNGLRSSLRKQDSVRKSLGLRVRFVVWTTRSRRRMESPDIKHSGCGWY